MTPRSHPAGCPPPKQVLAPVVFSHDCPFRDLVSMPSRTCRTDVGISTAYPCYDEDGGNQHCNEQHSGRGGLFRLLGPLCRASAGQKALASCRPAERGLGFRLTFCLCRAWLGAGHSSPHQAFASPIKRTPRCGTSYDAKSSRHISALSATFTVDVPSLDHGCSSRSPNKTWDASTDR
jgi:hypothetical protein